MYGSFTTSCQIEEQGISVSIERRERDVLYRRDCRGTRAERVIGSLNGDIIINPVEPLNLPREVTKYLEIHFRPIYIEPESIQQCFLTFPVEIGVFVHIKQDYELIDVFSPVKPKYSLYGPPDHGCITRWHESTLYDKPPETDPLREGVLSLTLDNQGRTWIEVSRLVLVNSGMTIWYGNRVWMSARMALYSNTVAETRTLANPPEEGLARALPVYSAKKVSVVEMVNQIPFYSTKTALIPEKPGFLMEYGLGEHLATD